MRDFSVVVDKPLGFWKLTSLVLGNMIGSGIFLLPADLSKFGMGSLIAWGVTALGAFFLAILFSRLSLLVREGGGPYVYAKRGLGGFVGFQTVYNHWIAIWVGNLGLVLAMVAYLAMFFPVLMITPFYGVMVAIGVIWLLTFVNISGVSSAGTLQVFTTAVKIIPILILIFAGIGYFHPEYIRAHMDTLHLGLGNIGTNYVNIASASSLTLWAFIGAESAVVPYEHVKNPKRNIPLATLLGTGLAAIIYIASSTVVMGMLSPQALVTSPAPFIAAAEMMFGEWGKLIMAIGAVISCFGCINGWILVQGQVTMAAAKNNLFPRMFGLKNKAGAPVLGLVVTAVLQTIILLVTLDQETKRQLQMLMLMASLAALVPYLYTTFATFTIVKRSAGGATSFFDKFILLIASLASIYVFWSMLIAGREVIYYGSILVFTSALLYGWGYGGSSSED
jgi:basic amino acid/polyamine antiporter, APA family